MDNSNQTKAEIEILEKELEQLTIECMTADSTKEYMQLSAKISALTSKIKDLKSGEK